MLALVFVGVILAAQTDEPEFWLLIGAGPFALLNTIGIFFRKRLKRRDGLLVFCERDR